jgi:long-chain acyl-CoA synthetase
MLGNVFTQPADKIFLQTLQKNYTYAWLRKKIKQISGLFESLHLQHGDKIVLAISDDPEMSALFLAALAHGITVVMADPESKSPRAKSIVQRTAPKYIIADKETLEQWQLEESLPILSYKKEGNASPGLLVKFLKKNKPEAASNDYLTLLEKAMPADDFPEAPAAGLIAYILFTSGTTADAKGVSISHGNLAMHLATLKKVYGLDEDSRLLNLLFLCHADGCVQGPLLAAFAGCSWHKPFRFTLEKIPAFLDYGYAHNISHVFVVPAMLNMILPFADEYEDSFQYPEFKAIVSVSAHLDAALWDKFENAFKVPLSNVFGLTETVAGSLFCGPMPGTYRKYSVGKPVDCELKIINELHTEVGAGETGELCLRGAHIMENYWSDPAATTEAFTGEWFLTGDLASKDEDGFITIRGRKKNLIISGGINIQPEEVTECLLKNPGISEACAIGMPDEVFGEKLVAAVVLKTGYALSGIEIIETCRLSLEEKKVPHRIFIVDELPKGISGKVQLNTLREQLLHLQPLSSVNTGDFASKILSIAAESFQVPASRLSIQDTSQTVAGWDSLAHLSFITSLEDHFQVRFNTAEVITMNSIRRATELIKLKHG